MISQFTMTAIGVQFIFGNTVGTVLARIAFTRRLTRYGRKRSVLKDYSMFVMRFRRRFGCQCFVQSGGREATTQGHLQFVKETIHREKYRFDNILPMDLNDEK